MHFPYPAAFGFILLYIRYLAVSMGRMFGTSDIYSTIGFHRNASKILLVERKQSRPCYCESLIPWTLLLRTSSLSHTHS